MLSSLRSTKTLRTTSSQNLLRTKQISIMYQALSRWGGCYTMPRAGTSLAHSAALMIPLCIAAESSLQDWQADLQTPESCNGLDGNSKNGGGGTLAFIERTWVAKFDRNSQRDLSFSVQSQISIFFLAPENKTK